MSKQRGTPRTAPPGSVVVKVGGSLYDQPNLGPALRAYLAGLDAPKVLVVAGGGRLADAVREFDRCHRLGEEAAHHLALDASRVSAWFVAGLLFGEGVGGLSARLAWWTECEFGRFHFLDCRGFLNFYEMAYGRVPHTWDLTTDSVAALAAKTGRCRLILLKSIDVPPDTDWRTAAANRWVDPYFPTAVADAPFPIEAVNFRHWLGETSRGGSRWR